MFLVCSPLKCLYSAKNWVKYASKTELTCLTGMSYKFLIIMTTFRVLCCRIFKDLHLNITKRLIIWKYYTSFTAKTVIVTVGVKCRNTNNTTLLLLLFLLFPLCHYPIDKVRDDKYWEKQLSCFFLIHIACSVTISVLLNCFLLCVTKLSSVTKLLTLTGWSWKKSYWVSHLCKTYTRFWRFYMYYMLVVTWK